jgi:ABC-type methionine transport system ATPase subunit
MDAHPAYRLNEVCQECNNCSLLSSLSLEIPLGGFTALIGPSGAGKTTLLRLLNRLDDPCSGSIEFMGQDIQRCPVRQLRVRAGFVFQAPAMFASSVADNLILAAHLAGIPKQDVTPTRIAELLACVELPVDMANREASTLSGGEKQRVALARTLMTRPEVLLLDEPTAALDPEVADRLMETLCRLREQGGLTLVMVTHRLREAVLASTHVVMLESGRVVEAGPTEQVLRNPTQERTRTFLNAAGSANFTQGAEA